MQLVEGLQPMCVLANPMRWRGIRALPDQDEGVTDTC